MGAEGRTRFEREFTVARYHARIEEAFLATRPKQGEPNESLGDIDQSEFLQERQGTERTFRIDQSEFLQERQGTERTFR
jgi:hypothetical protein